MADTKIEWADRVWNPVTGCTPISEACQNCYARRMSKRLAGRFGYPADDPFSVALHEERVKEIYKWKKPQKIFICSMGDLFHEDVPESFVLKVLMTARDCEQHTFMVLTKRPQRMKQVLEKLSDRGMWPLNHVWLGVTAENQQRAAERIPFLLQIPALVKFVSIEPMLGPIDLINLRGKQTQTRDLLRGWVYGYYKEASSMQIGQSKIDWVIAGGETGPGARPTHPDWIRSLRDQCIDADTPLFFKSWGDWRPTEDDDIGDPHKSQIQFINNLGQQVEYVDENTEFEMMIKTGKKESGRMIDGEEWLEFPE